MCRPCFFNYHTSVKSQIKCEGGEHCAYLKSAPACSCLFVVLWMMVRM